MAFLKCLLNARTLCKIIDVTVCSPIDWPVCVQQLKDRFAVHFCRDINTGHVQQSRRQIDI